MVNLGLPKLTVAPAALNVASTMPAKFSTTVAGVGKENFSYQWKHNRSDLTEETHATLNITSVTESHSGKYDCIVKNEYGDSDVSSAELIMSSVYNIIRTNVCFM